MTLAVSRVHSTLPKQSGQDARNSCTATEATKRNSFANPCTALHFLFYCFPYIDWPGKPDERASAQTPPQIPASYNFLVGTRLDQPPNIASGTGSLHLLQPQLSGFALHSTMSSSCICEVDFPTIRCESSFFRPGAKATNV
jgi:hypothetical protein